jgi:Ca-activated chloride channel family protein
MLTFGSPLFLLLLLALPLFFILKNRKSGKIVFSSIELLSSLKMRKVRNPKFILLIIRTFAIAALIIALARPQSGRKFTDVTSEGVDILLLLDTSGSMKALDFRREGKQVDRLSVVKNVVEEFVKKRQGDRLGLIVFGDEAFTQCPLTTDHGIVIDFLKKVEIGMVGEATSIGSAIGVGVNRIKDIKSKEKILILLTDGRNTAGQLPPQKAAELAKKYNIKIYTIGVGTMGKAPFKVDTIFGERFVYQEVDLDEPTLRAIAGMTGGQYYRATDTDKLKLIYEQIDELEKTEIKVKEYTEYDELFQYFVLLGFGLLLIEVLLSFTVLRSIP